MSLQHGTQKLLGSPGGFCFSVPPEMLPETLSDLRTTEVVSILIIFISFLLIRMVKTQFSEKENKSRLKHPL